MDGKVGNTATGCPVMHGGMTSTGTSNTAWWLQCLEPGYIASA